VIGKELTIRVVLSMPVEETFCAVEIIESGRYPLDRMHTRSLPASKPRTRPRAGRGDRRHEPDPPGDRAWRAARGAAPAYVRGIRHFVRPLAESHFDRTPLLTERHLTQRLFGQILGRVERRAGHPT